MRIRMLGALRAVAPSTLCPVAGFGTPLTRSRRAPQSFARWTRPGFGADEPFLHRVKNQFVGTAPAMRIRMLVALRAVEPVTFFQFAENRLDSFKRMQAGQRP